MISSPGSPWKMHRETRIQQIQQEVHVRLWMQPEGGRVHRPWKPPWNLLAIPFRTLPRPSQLIKRHSWRSFRRYDQLITNIDLYFSDYETFQFSDLIYLVITTLIGTLLYLQQSWWKDLNNYVFFVPNNLIIYLIKHRWLVIVFTNYTS